MDVRDFMATNVRTLRAAHKLTQEELADRTEISSRYLGSIERAKVSASIMIVGRIAAALNVAPHELLMPPSTISRSPG